MKIFNSKQVVIVQSNVAPSKWRNTLADSTAWAWIYFGKNTQRFYTIKKVLSERGQMLNSGEMINRVAEEIRVDFINFDQHLDLRGPELLWQTTDVAEKNPYTSDFFYNCCAYLAFDQVLQTLDTNLLVFVEDWFLGWQMVKHAHEVGFRSCHLTGRSVLDICPDRVKHALYRIRQMLRAVSCRVNFVCHFYRKKRIIAKHPRTNTLHGPRALGNLDALLVTWADPNTFHADRAIQADTYYGRLPEFLRAQGKQIGYITSPVSWVYPFEEIVENIQSAQDRVVLPEECLGLKEVLSIAWTTFFFSVGVKSRLIIQGVDVTELLKDELRKERTKSRQCWATQFYYIGRFLLKHGVKPLIVIHLYENQPWEKALRLGIKRYQPETRIVGYLHAPFAPLWLGYYPSRRDLQMAQIPDCIVTLGPKWKMLFSEHGYPPQKLRIGAALRFESIFGQLDQRGSDGHSNSAQTRTILIAGPGGYADSFELIHKTLEALREMPEVEVLIKFHPDIGAKGGAHLLQSVLETLDLRHLPDHFAISERPIPELLQSVGLVLQNGTSVALEALTRGLPVVSIQPDIWFDMDTLAFWPGVGVVARTPDEIRQAVHRLLNEDEEATRSRREKAEVVLRQIFHPVREDTVQCFFDFGEEDSQ